MRAPPKRLVVVLAVLMLAAQSCTIMLPLAGRVVDSRTGLPVRNAQVLAVWRTTIATPAGSLPGTVIRRRIAMTDILGRYRIGPGVAIHVPVLPFSWHLRFGMYLPIIEVSASGYASRVVFNAPLTPQGFAAPQGILFVHGSEWSGRDIGLSRSKSGPGS